MVLIFNALFPQAQGEGLRICPKLATRLTAELRRGIKHLERPGSDAGDHHADAGTCIKYIFRDGAAPLGGTLPAGTHLALQKELHRKSRGQPVFHVTLSLLKGLHASDQLWLRIAMTVLAGLSIRHHRHGWFAARHSDADCDHIHIAVAGCDFDGVPAELNNSRAHTDQLHRHVAARLGLELPLYYDGTVPSLRPVQPARLLHGNKRVQIVHAALSQAFLEQPVTVEELNARMAGLPGGYQTDELAREWYSSDHFLRGKRVGPGWAGPEILARLSHCAALVAARSSLELNRVLRQDLRSPPASHGDH